METPFHVSTAMPPPTSILKVKQQSGATVTVTSEGGEEEGEGEGKNTLTTTTRKIRYSYMLQCSTMTSSRDVIIVSSRDVIMMSRDVVMMSSLCCQQCQVCCRGFPSGLSRLLQYRPLSVCIHEVSTFSFTVIF